MNVTPSTASPPLGAPGLREPAGALLGLGLGLALLATLLSRALIPALRGLRTGLTPIIDAITTLSSFTSALGLVLLGAYCVKTLLQLLSSAQLPAGFRLALVPLGTGACTLVFLSPFTQLDTLVIAALALTTALLLLATAPPLLARAATRGVGLALALTALSGVVALTSRGLALRASEAALPGLFERARLLATAAFALDVVAVVVAAAWLAAPRWRLLALAAPLTLLTALGLTRAVTAGGLDSASLGAVLVRRAVLGLARHPAPLTGLPLRITLEVATVLLCGALVGLPGARREQRAARGALAFALLSHGALDIPFMALCGVVAMTLATVAALQAPRSNPRRLTPTASA